MVTNNTVPKTINEAVVQLMLRMTDKEKDVIKGMIFDDLFWLHHTLGQTCRNEFRMWGGNQSLLDSCEAAREKFNISATPGYPKHPDDMSMVVIAAFWFCLQDGAKSIDALIKESVIIEPGWVNKFITGKDGDFIAWDETQVNKLGNFPTRNQAVKAVLDHAKELNGPGEEDGPWAEGWEERSAEDPGIKGER